MFTGRSTAHMVRGGHRLSMRHRIGTSIGDAISVCMACVHRVGSSQQSALPDETFVRGTQDSMTAFTSFPIIDFRHTGLDQLARAYRGIAARALAVEPMNGSPLAKRSRYIVGTGTGAGGRTS